MWRGLQEQLLDNNFAFAWLECANAEKGLTAS